MSAVNISLEPLLGVCVTDLARSTLYVLTAVTFAITAVSAAPTADIASASVNVPTTSWTNICVPPAATGFATIPVAPETEPTTLSPAKKVAAAVVPVIFVNILISKRYSWNLDASE